MVPLVQDHAALEGLQLDFGPCSPRSFGLNHREQLSYKIRMGERRLPPAHQAVGATPGFGVGEPQPWALHTTGAYRWLLCE